MNSRLALSSKSPDQFRERFSSEDRHRCNIDPILLEENMKTRSLFVVLAVLGGLILSACGAAATQAPSDYEYLAAATFQPPYRARRQERRAVPAGDGLREEMQRGP